MVKVVGRQCYADRGGEAAKVTEQPAAKGVSALAQKSAIYRRSKVRAIGESSAVSIE
jgi:hypothetical protein